MANIVRINKQDVHNMDLSSVYEYMDWNPTYRGFLTKNPGEEHYKLLAYMGALVARNNTSCQISDIGTLYGSSALAFSVSHPTAQVTTYDIMNVIPNVPGLKSINNVTSIKRKIMSGQLDIANIAKSHLILLDIDPHEGTEEIKFVNLLQKAGYKGMMLVDDIKLNDGMKKFWESVEIQKYDLTELGHWTGTGLIVFDPDVIDVKIV
jgi:hypothetical protein